MVENRLTAWLRPVSDPSRPGRRARARRHAAAAAGAPNNPYEPARRRAGAASSSCCRRAPVVYSGVPTIADHHRRRRPPTRRLSAAIRPVLPRPSERCDTRSRCSRIRSARTTTVHAHDPRRRRPDRTAVSHRASRRCCFRRRSRSPAIRSAPVRMRRVLGPGRHGDGRVTGAGGGAACRAARCASTSCSGTFSLVSQQSGAPLAQSLTVVTDAERRSPR